MSRRTGTPLGDAMSYLFMLVMFVFFAGPLTYLLSMALRDKREVYRGAARYIPDNPTIQNFITVLNNSYFPIYLWNGLKLAALSGFGVLIVALPAAYAFSRFRFAGRRVLMTQFLVINMFPIVLLILPLFVLMRRLGLLDTHIALIIANATVAIPFAIWMMTSYIDAIPKSLDEAAMTDGCSRLGALWRVILPLCIPGLVATGIYIFITAWNEYLYALTLGGRSVRTMTVAIQTLIGEYQIEWGLLTAGGVVGALPATILFLLVQKRLIGGLTQGAVKG